MEEPNIDLIPAEERIRKSKEKAKKTALGISLVLFVITMGVAGYVYYALSQIQREVDAAAASVESKKTKINERSQIEIAARNLDAKYNVLSELIANRLYYSLLLDELSVRTPSNITITSLDSSEPTKANLAGIATDYVSLAKFLSSLSDPKFSTASASEKNLFKEVQINTVTLDPADATARFNLSLILDTELLKKE